MKFLLAGEGSSDLGTIQPDGTLKKGAMTLLVDAISKKKCGKKPEYQLITEIQLKLLKKKDRRNTMGRCKEYKPFEEVFLSAKYLGMHVRKVFQNEVQAGIIFFKDSDGTKAAPIHIWESIVKAMQAGFAQSEHQYGVPMVPRPKSEAWLMGYYQKYLPYQQAYNHCKRFEDMSGNDSSPKALKKLLKKALRTDGDIYELIGEEQMESIQWERIDMPSLNLFRKRLENVLAEMTGSKIQYPVSETKIS